ncbi:hypothetical protein ACH4XT_33895 [Streptomyces avidinii]|uniref:hypothetical protein n=1 Tax=Streptomyces avidinii TaxID=1895 RepID=UPI0037B2DD9E
MGAAWGGVPSTLTCTEPTRNRPAAALRPSTRVGRRAAVRVGERSNGAANGRGHRHHPAALPADPAALPADPAALR